MEVAIVFIQMLGIEEAILYMAENGIPQHVADRILARGATIRTSDGVIAWNCQYSAETESAISNPQAGAPLSIAPQERTTDHVGGKQATHDPESGMIGLLTLPGASHPEA